MNLNDHILSADEIITATKSLNRFSEGVNSTKDYITTIIDTFENEGVAISLFKSGNFGKEKMEQLENVKEVMLEYYNAISSDGGLIPVTRNFLNAQLDRVENGSGK